VVAVGLSSPPSASQQEKERKWFFSPAFIRLKRNETKRNETKEWNVVSCAFCASTRTLVVAALEGILSALAPFGVGDDQQKKKKKKKKKIEKKQKQKNLAYLPPEHAELGRFITVKTQEVGADLRHC